MDVSDNEEETGELIIDNFYGDDLKDYNDTEKSWRDWEELQKEKLKKDKKQREIGFFIWDGCTVDEVDKYILGGSNIQLKTSNEILITDTDTTNKIIDVNFNKVISFISVTLIPFNSFVRILFNTTGI